MPLLPDGDRYIAALYALGEPCRTVAAALSILWPLGRPAAALVAASTGLSADAVGEGVRRLVDEGILDELPGKEDTAPRGWTFRIPLMAHNVRDRLGPLERSRLSAAAVEALWAAGRAASTGTPQDLPKAAILDEADAQTYLPDRIIDAGGLVDRERAVAELTAAAEPLYPDLARRGAVRWLLGAVRLIDQPSSARNLAMLRCGGAAYGCGDYSTARSAAESILRGSTEGLDPLMLHELATLLVAATRAEEDWPALSRMGTASWWDGLPALATVAGRVQALFQLEKWQEALSLLARTEPLWQTDPRTSALMTLYRRCMEYVLGRPDRLIRSLTLPDVPDVPHAHLFAMAVAQFDFLLGVGDMDRAAAFLSARGLRTEMLPLGSLFLWHHLQGRWDQALALARRILVNGGMLNVAPGGHHLLAARTAAVLLARGRTTSAQRLISSMRGRVDGPLEHILDHADAEVLRTLGDLGGAQEILRRGLGAADERGSVYGTAELWASLAEVHAEAGHIGQAVPCLERLEQLDDQMDSGRTRLLYLLTSVQVLRPGIEDTRSRLLEAVGLARSRNQPFETAVTLSAAARAHAVPANLLHEAYELFGEIDASLCRFHTRTAMREAGLVVPGRKQTTWENEHVLATMVSEGLTNRQIATVLRLSEDAVANRVSRLFTRTGTRSRTELVALVVSRSAQVTTSSS